MSWNVFEGMSTTVLIIVGWLVVFSQARSIKRREEILELVNKTRSTVHDIHILCIKYYEEGCESHQNFISSDIRGKFVLLSHYLLLLKRDIGSGDISNLLITYKKNVTGGHFETVTFKEQLTIPGWRLETSASANELVFAIDNQFMDWSKRANRLLSFA